MVILNAQEMRQADEHAIRELGIPSIILMENAARSVVNVVLERFPAFKKAVFVCGKGNNGGDGFAAARLLAEQGFEVQVLLTASSAQLKDDPAVNWKKAQAAGVICRDNVSAAELPGLLGESDLLIDALFGTGLAKPLEGEYSAIVQHLNRTGKPIVSIDVPSGISSDHGELLGSCIRANITVALASLKYCHILAPACKMCGETYVVDIGIPVASTTKIVRGKDIRAMLPHRKVDSHKGTFGHAVVIGGSTGKSGAPYMAGKAALRAGAGLATVVTPSRVQPIVASMGPEIMTMKAEGDPDFFSFEAAAAVAAFLKDKNAVAMGPGMGALEATLPFLRDVIQSVAGALVIDADGLNLLAMERSLIQSRARESTVLTPHPGEMARLLRMDTAAVQKNRIASARMLAQEMNSIVVLKGFRTVIADPEGRIWINPTGGASLASGGTGDILTGVIAGFLAQRLTPREAALAGVYTHGLVANLFEEEFPQQALNAMDILQSWNRAIQIIRSEEDVEGRYLKIRFCF